MIKTYQMLLHEYAKYKAPDNKIARMVANEELIKLTKGLYVTDKNISGYLLANILYSPSYLSFDYALSYYGLIPEAVYTFTSATFQKEKIKKYKNFYGTFQYRDIPKEAFPFEVVIKKEQEYSYKIATAEKALCDKLYSMRPVKNQKELQALLFENLRIDENEFNKLDFSIVLELCDLYHSTNLKLLKKVVRKRNENGNTRNDESVQS